MNITLGGTQTVEVAGQALTIGSEYATGVNVVDSAGAARDISGYAARGTLKSLAGATLATYQSFMYDAVNGQIIFFLSAATTGGLSAQIAYSTIDIYTPSDVSVRSVVKQYIRIAA